MTIIQSLVALSSVALLGACATPSQPPVASESDVAGARAAAGKLGGQLKQELQAAMQAGGPQNAIGVCKERAPALAASVSAETGYRVHRVSDKNRNPEGRPDAWEAGALDALQARLDAGEPAETLETWAVVETSTGRELRYARAIAVAPQCLACHGPVENLPQGVSARLQQDYPHDRATGYSTGQLRGLFSVAKPL